METVLKPQKPIFLIAAPSYTNESGGAMVLHQLCHLLNELGEAYVVPMPRGSVINWLNIENVEKLVAAEKNQLANFKTCPSLKTPIFSSYPGLNLEACVAVYPEVVLGNPFQFNNVARWVLYHSGFHRRISCTSKGEVEFKFNQEFAGAKILGFSETADLTLYIWMPDEETISTFRRNIDVSQKKLQKDRIGVAYCIRKGQKRQHDLIGEDAICIDGKSMDEIIVILKKVKYFVSFDPDTYYSELAVAHGCCSLISSPNYEGKEADALRSRPYIAFSTDQIEASWKGRTALLQKFEDAATLSRQNVAQFYDFWDRRINIAQPDVITDTVKIA